MRRVLWAIVCAVLLAGFAKAQGAMTGEWADKAKVEVISSELRKMTYLVQNYKVSSDWRNMSDSDVIISVTPERGIDRASREWATSRMLIGELFMISQYHFGHRVWIYDNGNAAVMVYYADALFREKGKAVPRRSLEVDVLVKTDDAAWPWKRIAHTGSANTNLAIWPAQSEPIIGVKNHY